MLFFFSDHIHLVFTNLILEPWRGCLAYSMMMANGSSRFRDRFKYAILQVKILTNGINFGDENEVKVGALGVRVGNMGHADRIRSRFYESSHVLVDLWHLGPGYTAFERVNQNAVILQVLA